MDEAPAGGGRCRGEGDGPSTGICAPEIFATQFVSSCAAYLSCAFVVAAPSVVTCASGTPPAASATASITAIVILSYTFHFASRLDGSTERP